jgi:large subunit ribosomal protein L13
MLPYKRSAGKEAFKRIKVYVGVPSDLVGSPMATLEEAHMDRLNTQKTVSIGAVSTFLGAKF